jgi:cellobiose phosphorylase
LAKFGHFSENGSEYVITSPQAPRPLLNYIWNTRMVSGINQFGGGNGAYGNRAASYIDPKERGRANLILDGNRYFYIRDDETGDFWNPGWYPVRRELDSYSCTHGLGYSIIEGSRNGIKARVRIFINCSDPVEICTILLSNMTKNEKRLKVYSFADFALDGYERYSEYDSYVSCEYDPENNLILAHNTAQERPHEWFDGFTASSRKISGYESGKNTFLGTYGNISAPASVVKGACSNILTACERMVGVLENSIILSAESEIEFHILIGSTNSSKTAADLTKKLFESGKIESDFQDLKSSKRKLFEGITVETPDAKVNQMMNYWAKEQVLLCAEVGRSTGKGFRDQLQDSWAVTAFNHELAKVKIIDTLKHEYRDGRCVRGWLPLDHHIYSDGPTWIAPAVNAYIKETGETDFLDCVVPYLDEGEGTVWDHIVTAAEYSSHDIGKHGLVLAHDGDWNDSLNGIGVGGKGESVWTSIALCNALINTAEIAVAILHDGRFEQKMLEKAKQMKDAINQTGWDGEWYLAGYTDKGLKVGSRSEREGSIYLNSQTWAVLTGVAEGERLKKCLNAIDEKLSSLYGPLTLYPPYTSYNKDIGRLTSFVPGIWENGTPYCHGGAFKVVADCFTGRGNHAYETLQKIMPDSQWNPSDHSGCEPYVFTNMYFGPSNPRAGQSSFAWITGTAGWMFRAVTQYMMGFYPGYDTITINPCIPGTWEKADMTRCYRGDRYALKILNPNHSQNTIDRILVEGTAIQGNTFPIFKDGNTHEITVIMK